MATKKTTGDKPAKATKATKTAAVPESKGLKAGGGGPIREGYSFSPEYDKYFAFGYPYLRLVVDGLPEDKDPEKSALKILKQAHANERFVWPRETAHRLVRAWGTYFLNYTGVTPEAAAAVKVAGPVSADEARSILESHLHNAGGAMLYNWVSRNFVFLMEALVGPGVVVDAILDRLELLPQEEWIRHNRPDRCECVKLSGFLLARLSEAERAPRRARFEALYQRGLGFGEIHLDYGKMGYPQLTKGLDILLHGAEGAERSCYRYGVNADIPNPDDWALVEDTGALVNMADRKHEQSHEELTFSAHHAYSGGDAMLDVFARRWKDWLVKIPAIKMFLETFGRIKNPRIARIVGEMYATTNAKDETLAWMQEHADYVRPILQDTGEPWAAQMLKQLAAD